MKLTIGLLAALLAGAAPVHAQGVSVGLKAGFNLAKLSIDDPGATVGPDNRTGLVAGVFVIVPTNSLLAFQPEVLFSRQGAKFTDGDDSGSLKIDYVQVPLLARIKPPTFPIGIVVGPALGFRAHATLATIGESEGLDYQDFIKRSDVGLVAGAFVDFARIVLDGRYTWGLTNIAKDPGDGEVKNRVFSATIGVRF